MPKAKELQDEMTLVLRKPVTLSDGKGGESTVYEQLSLREPLVEEMLVFSQKAAKDPGDAVRHLIAKISGVPLAVINKMRARDFTEASNYLMAFMTPEDASDDPDSEDEAAGEGGTGN
ncbi:phage tail assembly protein [Bordetella bronchialis]|uniref:Phage tail assembly protein n=1 Tax=Bordetella bronchialis TaxID=463025 RepID=A0A193FUQ8_9BORD|nr:phage tail assembly protein [Bordetella bronchialis]ANN70916.1 hypothetical protein BAU08_05840 [Bordetella bronchialis]